MSLKKEFDQKGPFPLTEDGKLLTKESYARAMAIINKHAWLKFHIVKRDLVENRYSLYQERSMKEYDKMISTQVTKFVREQDNMEEKALVFLQIEERIFTNSQKAY